MTKSMWVRLSLATMTVVALAVVALMGWGSSQETTQVVSADRPGTETPRDDDVRARQTNVALRQASAQGRATAQADDGSVTLTLLHNNDGESKLLPDAEAGFPGIARFADTWVGLGRSTDADILLRVSSGDNFLASKEFAAGLARDGQPLYDSIALRGLYEAMGLGNHDFDFGPDVTARFIEGFRVNETSNPVPFVAANIDVSGEPALQALVESGRLAPSTVFTDPISELSIGIIGALTPRLPNISSPRNVIVDADVAGAVNAEAAALIEQGIDRIVLVSHLQGLAEDEALVPQLSGVDIVVAGGGDELLKNDGDTCQSDDEAFAPYPLLLQDRDGNEVPVVTAPGGYRCIGRLDVTFDADGNISAFDGSSIGVPLDGDAEEFAVSRVEQPLAAALAGLDATVLGASDVDLDGRRNSVRTASTNVGSLLADALLSAGQAAPDFGGPSPVVAVQNGGGIRNDSLIPAGEISEARTFDIAPFANFVVTGEVSRDRFKELLEVGVAGLPAAEGTFPQIAGFSMDVDVSQPARLVDSDGDCAVIDDPGSRVQNVTLDDGTEIVRDGRVVAGDDLAIATIDFLAGGGDCYPLGDIEFTKVGASYQQALSTFITSGLNGQISADSYPITSDRIEISGSDETDGPEEDRDAEAAPAPPLTDAAEEPDTEDSEADAAAETAAADPEVLNSQLPKTGLNSWLVLIVALTVAAAGVLIFIEAQRAGWLSFANRVSATRAWIPESDDES